MKTVYLGAARQWDMNYHKCNLVCNDLFVKKGRIVSKTVRLPAGPSPCDRHWIMVYNIGIHVLY